MKTRSQKLISLVLVLMMLVTMIPAGFFGASAVSAELAAGLADYANTSEFVINSVEDWEAVAASGKDFSGKTVKLGANIDAQGATLPMLAKVDRATGNCGIFLDGQGFAIMNVGTAEAPQTEPLVTNKFSNGTVKNVTFQNVVMVGADATYGSGLVADWVNGWGTATVKDVKVLGCSISDTAGPASAIFGRVINNDDEVKCVIDGVVIDAATKINAKTYAGSVIGHVTGNGGIYTVSRVYTEAYLEAPTSGYTGGLVGYVNPSGSFVAQFNFNDCVVKGTLIATGGSGWTGRVGGVFGRATSAQDINVADCIFAPAAVTTGLVLCQTITAANGSQDVSVTGSYKIASRFTSDFYFENSSSKVNGVAHASGHEYGLAGVSTIAAGNLSYYYSTNSNGFVTDVAEPSGILSELLNFSTTTTFTINSADDWNKLAAYSAANSSTTWSGKTIKLGADIIGEVDANGVPTTVLNQLSPTQFYGTFDGNNKTIKNVKVTNNSLFTNKIDGTTFKNVTFDNLVLTGTGNYSGIFTTIVNDWASSTFSNITVKNTTVTAKAADSGMFCGIVDNKGGTLTFSNITIEDSTLIGASHTGLLFGSVQEQRAATNLVIDGITINNVNVTNKVDANLGGLIGWVRSYANSAETTTMTIKNVDIKNINVSSGENYATGGLIGRTGHAIYNIALENINIAGSVTTTSATDTDYIGGVIGKIEANGTVSVQKLYSNMTVTSTTAAKLMIGGFCAYVGVASGKQFVMEDSYIGGAVVANTAHSTSTAGVICKIAGKAGENIANISNIVVNVDMTGAAGNAMTILGVHDGNALLSKCYSVTKSNGGNAASGKVRWSFMTFNGTSTINGVANGWANVDPAGDQFVTIITAQAAAMMVKEDKNGYVAGVYTTAAVAYQASAVSGGKYAVRFIAFDFMGDATNVSMNVIARVADGTGKSFTADCTMYDALKSYNSMGIVGSRNASDFDAKKIAGLTIYNIPTGNAIDFEVTVTYTTADGTFSNTMYLSFNASGVCTTPAAN